MFIYLFSVYDSNVDPDRADICHTISLDVTGNNKLGTVSTIEMNAGVEDQRTDLFSGGKPVVVIIYIYMNKNKEKDGKGKR